MNKSPSLNTATSKTVSEQPDTSSFWMRVFGVLRTFIGKAERALDLPFTLSEIGALHKVISKVDGDYIDDQTWKDLSLNSYAEILSSKISIFGQQLLHFRLRRGSTDTESVKAVTRYLALSDDTKICSLLRVTFEPLRELDTEVSNIVFSEINLSEPWWVKHILAFQIAIILVMSGAIFSFALLSILCVSIVVVLIVQATWNTEVESFDRNLDVLRVMLKVAKELATIAKNDRSPLLQEFMELQVDIDHVNDGITRSPWETGIPGAQLYADWFMLSNIRHHFRAIEIVRRNQTFLQRCYQLVGNLEADLAIAHHLSNERHICWATRQTNGFVSFSDVINPLLTNAAPLSIELDSKGVFLSGQNGSGKSTFLRTLGINLVVGRSLGFCYATKATVPTFPVYTSIQIEDSMVAGESLYIAELKRAREMLRSSEGRHKGIYIVDEIFRGTNHLESVSAAAAVIHALAGNALVIVSSHNLVLSALLEKWLTPLRIESHGSEFTSMTVGPGVLDDPNGIHLLSTTGFDSKISENANGVFSWLSAYLAHPDACPELLR